MDTPGKVIRPAEIKSCVHKENDAKGKSVYDGIPENEISSREDTNVGQLPTSVHCSDYLQQTLSDLMQLNPDDFIIHGDQQRQFSHHVLQDTNSETVEDIVCGSSNVGSNLKEITGGSCSNSNSRSVDITGENNDANDIYYTHIYDCVVRDTYPEGYCESYYTALKKRARHYCVINGTLYYNRKQPREVIIKRHQQQKILQNAHIEIETGIHLGAKRMHEAINKTFFWRGMYMDIITFVRDCQKCAESFSGSHLPASAQCKLDKTHENDNNDNFSVNNENLLDTDLGIRNGVWQKVIIKLCGPYPKTADDNEYLITIADPVSMWVCVKPTTNERNIKTVSTFIIKIFCLLGFAECCFIGFTTEELENVQQHCKEGMFESEITSCMFGSKSRQTSETELLGADECSWSTDLLNEFVNCYPSDWDTKVQSFLHTYHVSTGCDSLTPFYKLHGRNPKFILEANKENRTKDISISKVHAVFSAREKSPNSVLQIHPNSSEGAQQCETLVRDNCSLLHRKFRRKILAESHQGNPGSRMQTGTAAITERRAYITNRNQQQNTMKINQPSEIRANTVACVKKLLESAKEKKRKRGKYHKYSPEIREQIAQYVAENGAGEAARCFSEKLGRVVSESTVRNIFKLYSNYTPELKQEIGKYAMTYGVQAASDHFTQKLGRAIRLGIVHKFKRFYLNQIPAQLKKKIHKKRSNVNRKRHYSDELKEEIGNYAFKYTVGAAIRHYSRKFGYPITETVVRRFRKMYLQKTFDKQSQWKQKQEHLSSQQKGEQLQPEREQEQIYLNFQENHVRNQMEQAFPQNHVHERCAQSTDAASTMQTINILHSSMSVLNDPQFSDSHNDIFPPPCEPVALPSNCSSFDQHTNTVLDIQPYIQCSGTVVSSALVFPSQFNHLADNALVSTDPGIPVQECQYNELYSYYSELNQQRDINSVSGNNYISPQQLPALSHFSDAELAGKTVSTLNGTPTHRKQQSFHLPNSSSLATDRLVSQIHSVLSQTGDVLFQQEGIQQLTDTNTAIQLNSDPIAGQNADDIIPVSKHSGDNCQLHTSSLCYSASNVSTKTSTEYSVNTLFDDHNIFLMPHRADCNVSTYNKYNEVKAPGIPSPTSQITVSEVNATGADATNGHSYSVQCSPSTMCSLTLQPLEPVVTRDLQIHETTATLNSSPSISTLNPQTSDHQSPLSFGTNNTNGSLTQKMLKTPMTPTALGENAGTLHSKLVINMKPLTSPADVPQNPVTPISSSLLKEKQVVTSCTTSSSCSVALQNETTCSFTNHPPLVQAPVNQPTPLYTVATASSGTTTKSIACAYALPHAQVEKKKNKIPLMYFSQSQFTEPPPLVAISHSKTSVKQSPSHITLFPVASMTETFSAMDSLTKIPPLAVVSYSTSSQLHDSGELQNSVVTYQSHSSGKQSPMHELHTTVAVSHHKKLKTVDILDSSEKTLDQRIANQTKLSDESLICSLDKAIMSSKSSSSNTDHIKNKFNFVQKKIPVTVAPSSPLHSVNNGTIMQNHATNSQSTPSLVVSQQISPNIEVAITNATTAQTKLNSVENIHNTSMSSSFQNINTLAAKQNCSAPSCSLPHIVHKKIDLSPELSNLCITGTKPSASTVSVQTFVTISDSKHTATTTSTNSHVILMSSETANECRPRVSTVPTSSPVTTAIPVNLVSAVTSGNALSGAAEIPIITEYHNKQKEGMKNKYEDMKNLKHPATGRSKDEIHTSVMTLPTIQSYITVTSSNTPVMNHEVTIPCSSAVSNCTSTEGSGFTSSTLATTKSENSSQCYTGSTCVNNSSCNGINRLPSGNNLSDGATTMYFGNATTSVSTMLSNKNCSLSRITSLDNSAEVSSSNTPAGETATSVVHCYLNNVPEICHSSTVLKLSDSASNSKKSSTSTDTTFYYKNTGCLMNTSTNHTDTTYSSNISSNSKTTPVSANNSLRCTTSISPSNGLSPGLVKGASDMTKGNKKPNHVVAKNSHKKPLSRNFKASKRGNYFVYSPELRAEMGKYAAEHGNQQACLYFKHILGVEVPSSTMRTLRDKYLLKLEHCTFDQKVLNNEVTSLGYGQRGRPMRLGKYDDEVRHCIQEIVKTGEPVSSYLVIETARQVLMQYEPSLLEENGGNIKLNVTWAKSFLKRTGIRNNS